MSQSVAGAGSPRRGRLTRSGDFDRVLRSGRSHAGRELILYVFPRGTGDDQPRLGLSVSRKVGGAVDRNTVKRLLREAFVREGDRLPLGSDAVVIARPPARELAHREGLSGIRAALAELISRVQGAARSDLPAEAAERWPAAGAGEAPSPLGSTLATGKAEQPLGAGGSTEAAEARESAE